MLSATFLQFNLLNLLIINRTHILKQLIFLIEVLAKSSDKFIHLLLSI